MGLRSGPGRALKAPAAIGRVAKDAHAACAVQTLGYPAGLRISFAARVLHRKGCGREAAEGMLPGWMPIQFFL